MKPFKKILCNCRQATRLSLKREEGHISLTERLVLAYHLLYCEPCRRFIRQWKSLAQYRGTHTLAAKPPFSLSTEARTRIQQQLDALKS